MSMAGIHPLVYSAKIINSAASNLCSWCTFNVAPGSSTYIDGVLKSNWNGSTDKTMDIIEVKRQSSNGSCGSGVTWTLTASGDLVISGNGAMSDYTTSPFIAYKDKITRIVVEEGVTKIGAHAFEGLINAKELIMLSNSPSYGAYAVQDLNSISSIKCSCTDSAMIGFAASRGITAEVIHTNSVTKVKANADTKSDGKYEVKCSRCGKIEISNTIAYPKDASLFQSSYIENGNIQRAVPYVIVDNNGAGIDISNATFSWLDSNGNEVEPIKAGTYKVAIKFHGSYEGTIYKPFAIVPNGTSSRYKATFNMGGHGTQISEQSNQIGMEVKKPANPTANGYEFLGWYSDANCTKPFDFTVAQVKDVTVYAKWGKQTSPLPTTDVSVSYRTHVQTYGWQDYVKNGATSGTYGQAKRLEGINIKVEGNDKLGIIYTTHCQTYGWLPWSANGDMNGTEGEAKRLEAIEIKLTGADKDKYDVCYRVHAQSYGWLGWAKNGAPAGTAGYAKRLEGIQIVVVKKGAAIPNLPIEGIVYAGGKAFYAKDGQSPIVNNPSTSNTNPVIPGETLSTVAYRTHVQSIGWQGWKFNGQMSGTSGMAKRLEGIEIKLVNKQYSGGITYRTHVQSYGWQGWKNDGDMSGTSGEAKRLEAIEIKLTGEMAKKFDVYYRVHAQSYGWLGWARNGASSGTAGLGKRLEGIQIVLVKKGDPAPSNSYMGITSVRTESYIKK